jgi:hypothetical protein
MIRPARIDDQEEMWTILEPVLRAGETYGLPRDMSRDAALAFWYRPDQDAFVAEEDGRILGTYFLRANSVQFRGQQQHPRRRDLEGARLRDCRPSAGRVQASAAGVCRCLRDAPAALIPQSGKPSAD